MATVGEQDRILVVSTNNETRSYTAAKSSTGAADANRVMATNAAGELDSTFLPAGVGSDTRDRPASEALTTGRLVNEYDDSGTTRIRHADRSNGRDATGFVLDNVANAATGTVYPLGVLLTGQSGLTPGAWYVLGTNGQLELRSSATFANGELLQEVGRALSATELQTVLVPAITWQAG